VEIYWVDGQFLPDTEAFISVKDIAVLRGYGVFDFMRTYNRRPFQLEEHVERLFNSAGHIGLEIRHSKEDICRIVREALKRNPHLTEANVRIVHTGGISSDGVFPEGKGKLIVCVTKREEPPASWYVEGVKVITVQIERSIPEAKSINYMSGVIAGMRARKEGAVEAVYVDRGSHLLEGTTTNIFFFKGGRLITPGEGILSGVTRTVILDHLVKDHFDIDLRDVKTTELPAIDEMFLSASNKEIVPVINVDGVKIGNGKPGPSTKTIMRLFTEYTTAYGKGLA
jgi:branched-chain amino acid aminotransferase